MELDSYPTTYTKTGSKWIQDLNVHPENIKLLEENTEGKLLNLSLGNNFFDLTPKAKVIKAKINKLNYIKLQSFCTANKTIDKMKRQPMDWEKIFPITYLIRG